jgi:hypothetical protein
MTLSQDIYIEDGGDLTWRIDPEDGVITIEVRLGRADEYLGKTRIHVWPNDCPELHARLCKVFGLEKETAPDVTVEDGNALGNEPDALVPAKAPAAQ